MKHDLMHAQCLVAAGVCGDEQKCVQNESAVFYRRESGLELHAFYFR